MRILCVRASNHTHCSSRRAASLVPLCISAEQGYEKLLRILVLPTLGASGCGTERQDVRLGPETCGRYYGGSASLLRGRMRRNSMRHESSMSSSRLITIHAVSHVSSRRSQNSGHLCHFVPSWIYRRHGRSRPHRASDRSQP